MPHDIVYQETLVSIKFGETALKILMMLVKP